MIKTLYVIHHSHTDIGYTHGQGRIVRYHAHYIRQAMQIARQRDDFKWTCETFYPVTEFFAAADEQARKEFLDLCRSGKIGLTAAFLHFTELADQPVYESLGQRVKRFAEQNNVRIDSAMMADVNGCSLAHARALAGAGVKTLLTCVHPHHGYVPLGKRQAVFHWDLSGGQSLLVYHIDHYHTGNELGLAPGAENHYTAGFTAPPKPFDDGALEERLPIYLQNLEAAGWTLPFAIVAVSGLITDNAPPSAAIADRIARWNAKGGSKLRIEMTTPAALPRDVANLPHHSGDWPDWWADGVAGDPEFVALFRHAQRQRRRLVAMSAWNSKTKVDLHQLDTNLALAAEHTFGHSASVGVPWNLLAQQLRLKKLGYAADAADTADVLAEDQFDALGSVAMSYDRQPLFRAINPFSQPLTDLVELELEHCEVIRWQLLADRLQAVEPASGKIHPHQLAPSLRGIKALVEVTLKPGETIDLKLQNGQAASAAGEAGQIGLPDGARDIVGNDSHVPPTRLLTPFTQIDWQPGGGISGWRDAQSNRQLIDSLAAPPFTLVASRMVRPKNGDSQTGQRRKLGRNRNAADAVWHRSVLRSANIESDGPICQNVRLEYEMPDCEVCQLNLRGWKSQPRVDAELVVHKSGSWDAENVYLSLPFQFAPDATLWVDRAGPMRPGVDQLAGSLIDFLGVQDSLGWCGGDFGVNIAMLDSHLIQVGPLEYGTRKLAGHPSAAPAGNVYAWLMTNYWETNFTPELAGFYSFRFSITWGKANADPAGAMAAGRVRSLGFTVMRP